MTMSISNHTFKTNEIVTIWYCIMAPEGPTGGTRGPPRPPEAIWPHYKSRGKWLVFKKRVKRHKHITENMTMSTCDHAFKTNEISTIWCRLKPPSPNLQHWVWPFYRGRVTFFKNPLNNQKVKCFMTNVCLFNYAYKSLLILTISNQVGAPGPPPDPPVLFVPR